MNQFVFFSSKHYEIEYAVFSVIAKIPNFSIISFTGVYGPKFTNFPQ